MIKDIDGLVNIDFLESMEMKENSDVLYTQEEAKKMSQILGNVYTISHGIHCRACGNKYKI